VSPVVHFKVLIALNRPLAMVVSALVPRFHTQVLHSLIFSSSSTDVLVSSHHIA
jgi:hypothetical protein